MNSLAYLVTTVLFLAGFWVVLSQADLVKKVYGSGLMQGSVYFSLLLTDFRHSWSLAVVGIAVQAAVTAVAWILVHKLTSLYKTTDMNEIARLRRMGQ